MITPSPPDYWEKNSTKRRPRKDYYHPDMPTRYLGHHFGTMWYEILEDCGIMWKNHWADYPKGMIVYEKRSKPMLHIVNYEWLRRQAVDLS